MADVQPTEDPTPVAPPMDAGEGEAPTTDDKKKKKASVCKKVFILADGSESSHADTNAVALEFRFTNGHTHTVREDDNPDDINGCFAWMGRSEKYGNGYAGAGGDANAAEELFEVLFERLAGGEWVKTREGGGIRPSMVADAVKAALVEQGETVDEVRYLTIKEKLKTADDRERALANKGIKAHYDRIRQEREDARIVKRADEATDLTAF